MFSFIGWLSGVVVALIVAYLIKLESPVIAAVMGFVFSIVGMMIAAEIKFRK